MSLCDNCKIRFDCKTWCDDDKCDKYKPIRNRDMLEKKIHEMTDQELQANNSLFAIAKGLGWKCGQGTEGFVEWLNKPLEKIYKIVEYDFLGNRLSTSVETYTLNEAKIQRYTNNENAINTNWVIEEEEQ